MILFSVWYFLLILSTIPQYSQQKMINVKPAISLKNQENKAKTEKNKSSQKNIPAVPKKLVIPLTVSRAFLVHSFLGSCLIARGINLWI